VKTELPNIFGIRIFRKFSTFFETFVNFQQNRIISTTSSIINKIFNKIDQIYKKIFANNRNSLKNLKNLNREKIYYHFEKKPNERNKNIFF